MKITKYTGSLLTGLMVLCVGSSAYAQDSLLKGAKATEGSTEVAKEGFEATVVPNDENDATEFMISAGGLFATGNSRSIAMTTASKLRLRRANNQYTADVAANYAQSSPDPDTPSEATVENYQGRIRYDRFLSDSWALFVADSIRRDRFQGLALRTNFDPGVAFYAIGQPAQRLWFEAGYDLQFDIRTSAAITDGVLEGQVISTSEVRHAARLFAGYDNTLNAFVTFNTGVEYLQAFADTNNWRLNWEVGLNSSISDQFSLATTFNLRFDNNPLPDVTRLDTVTAVSLVYTLK